MTKKWKENNVSCDKFIPYPLPANKTRTVFKTQTHKGKGSNELRFEDEAGKEEVFIHAQRGQSRFKFIN